LLGILLLSFQAFAAEKTGLTTDSDKFSYSTGVTIIRNLKEQGGEFNLDILIQGIRDGFLEKDIQLSDLEIKKILSKAPIEIIDQPAVQGPNIAKSNERKLETQNMRRAIKAQAALDKGVQLESNAPHQAD